MDKIINTPTTTISSLDTTIDQNIGLGENGLLEGQIFDFGSEMQKYYNVEDTLNLDLVSLLPDSIEMENSLETLEVDSDLLEPISNVLLSLRSIISQNVKQPEEINSHATKIDLGNEVSLEGYLKDIEGINDLNVVDEEGMVIDENTLIDAGVKGSMSITNSNLNDKGFLGEVASSENLKSNLKEISLGKSAGENNGTENAHNHEMKNNRQIISMESQYEMKNGNMEEVLRDVEALSTQLPTQLEKTNVSLDLKENRNLKEANTVLGKTESKNLGNIDILQSNKKEEVLDLQNVGVKNQQDGKAQLELSHDLSSFKSVDNKNFSNLLNTPKVSVNSSQFPTSVMQAIEKMQNNEGAWTKITLTLPSNQEVELSLQIQGGVVKTRFTPNSSELQNSLKDGWNQLIQTASSKGIVIAPPRFDSQAKGDNFENLNKSFLSEKEKEKETMEDSSNNAKKRWDEKRKQDINYFA